MRASAVPQTLGEGLQGHQQGWLVRWASSVADAKWQKLPPAAYLPDDTAPTALSWLRRRLPGVPDSVLHRLFRKRDVKMLTALGLRINARPDTQLPAGGVLAIPLSVQAKEHTARSLTPGEALDKKVDQLASTIREAVLHEDDDMLVLNKPPGMPVQGGNRGRVSLDQILRKHFMWRDQPPRLVHRLDADTSGALVVARTQDSAAWLSAAFARPAAAHAEQLAASGPASVQKWYQAVVVGAESVPDSCVVTTPVLGAAGHAVPAETRFSVRRRAPGLTWLDCELITGRKHQIRLHCADSLGMPVLGDSKYGRQRELTAELLASPDHAATVADLRALLRERYLFLHSTRICISAGRGKAEVDIEAPLPSHMRRLDRLLHWES